MYLLCREDRERTNGPGHQYRIATAPHPADASSLRDASSLNVGRSRSSWRATSRPYAWPRLPRLSPRGRDAARSTHQGAAVLEVPRLLRPPMAPLRGDMVGCGRFWVPNVPIWAHFRNVVSTPV